MVSFWSRKNSGSNRAEEPARQHDESGNTPARVHEDEPTERTRLLPNEGQGFLSPDDPAVR